MPKFRVGICEDHGGYLTVTAKTEEQAEDKAIELVNEYGLDDLPKKYEFEKTSRQVFIC